MTEDMRQFYKKQAEHELIGLGPMLERYEERRASGALGNREVLAERFKSEHASLLAWIDSDFNETINCTIIESIKRCWIQENGL